MNTEAVEKAWQHLIDSYTPKPGHPELSLGWDQDLWLAKDDECNTAGCFFGHAALAHGFIPRWDEERTETDINSYERMGSYGWWPGTPKKEQKRDNTISVSYFAYQILDLDRDIISGFTTRDVRELRDRLLEAADDEHAEAPNLPIPQEWLDKLESAEA